MPTPEELKAADDAAKAKAAADAKAKTEAEAKEKAEAEAKAAEAKVKASKSPSDPVKVKCGKVSWPAQLEGQLPVNHGPLPKEVKFEWRGQRFVIPVGGEMKGTMPREAAEFMLQRAARYWTLKAELSILEPTFK